MNNAILFFYNINISGIKKIKDNYYFNYLGDNYGIYQYNRDIEDSILIYNLNLELIGRGLNGYEIIKTNTQNILFLYENKYYILMKFPKINNRIININDILTFNYEIITNNYKKIDKSNWGILWSNKIDFIEYQFNQINNKYKIIDKSIDYFKGIWENAISYYNNNEIITNKYVSHKRINIEMDLLEFLNPLEFIIDYKERDIGDYIKSYIMNKNFTLKTFDNYLNTINKDRIILLISRLLFPTYYFDLYENIVIGQEKEEKLIEIIKKRNNILKYIKYLFDKYENFNIPYINWIKKEISLQLI